MPDGLKATLNAELSHLRRCLVHHKWRHEADCAHELVLGGDAVVNWSDVKTSVGLDWWLQKQALNLARDLHDPGLAVLKLEIMAALEFQWKIK